MLDEFQQRLWLRRHPFPRVDRGWARGGTQFFFNWKRIVLHTTPARHHYRTDWLVDELVGPRSTSFTHYSESYYQRQITTKAANTRLWTLLGGLVDSTQNAPQNYSLKHSLNSSFFATRIFLNFPQRRVLPGSTLHCFCWFDAPLGCWLCIKLFVGAAAATFIFKYLYSA